MVSACLLGYQVRYDGADQSLPKLSQRLSEFFTLQAFCPEMEIGLGVPRGKIALQQQGKQTKVIRCADQQDLTLLMQQSARDFLAVNTISGMILKDKSPSCGVNNCQRWDEQGTMQRNGTGIFAETVLRLQPDMPMLQSCDVDNVKQLQAFIQAVESYEY